MNRDVHHQRGSVTLILVAVTVAVLVAVAGIVVWQQSKSKDNNKPASNSQDQSSIQKNESRSDLKRLNTLSLTNEKVQITLPNEWSYVKGSSDYCHLNVTSDIDCREGALVTPGASSSSKAGDSNFFGISVGVYENPRHSNAQVWLEQDLNEGSASETDTTSRVSINGYDSYYWKRSYSGDGTSIEEIYYALAVDERAVLIYARTYEPRTLDDGRVVGDFRQYEQAIAEMIKTIKIQ